MNKYLERIYNGIVKENPTFILMLGMCPTLAVTSSAINGLGMGLSTTVVLILSNLLISLFRKVIPNGVRMPAFIVIVASLVTIVEFLLKAYIPALSSALGVYIPLIVVNCIILGRAESYASKNGPVESVFDGIGMGLGFTIGLTCIGLIREILGEGKAFGLLLANASLLVKIIILVVGILVLAASIYTLIVIPNAVSVLTILIGVVAVVAAFVALLGSCFTPITIFIMAPGAFLVLAILVVVMNIIRQYMDSKGKPLAKPSGCISGDCANCSEAAGCSSFNDGLTVENLAKEEKAIADIGKDVKEEKTEKEEVDE